MKYKFLKKWNEDTSITWQKNSRIELNYIIDHYNKWQMEDDFDSKQGKLLLAKIIYGKQTIGSLDGGSGYMDELNQMEEFVNNNINHFETL
jgi:hypothetical protein